MSDKVAIILTGLSYCEKYRHASIPNNINEIMVDYRESFANYKQYLINYFREKGFIIDIFIATNPSSLSEQLLNDYKPKDYLFIDDEDGMHAALRQHQWNTNNTLKDKTTIDSNIKKANSEIGDINSFKFYKINDKDIDAFKKNEIWGPSSRLQRNIKPIKGMELCLNYAIKNNIDYKNVVITRMDLLFKMDFNSCNIDTNKINIVTQMEDGYSLCDNFYIIPFYNLQGILNIYKKNINASLHKIRPDIERLNNINFIYNENNGSSKLSFYKINRIKLS